MIVAFLLPRPSPHIVGGFKMVYKYSDSLIEMGFDVTIIHDCSEIGVSYNLKNNAIKKEYAKILKIRENWYNSDKRIKIKYITHYSELKSIDFDVIIATAINTFNTAFQYYELCNHRRKMAYFIQGYENWDCTDDEIIQTYKAPVHKIVVSKWLYDIVCQYDDRVSLCSNGIAFDSFCINNPIESRFQHSIAFMYHESDNKGYHVLEKVLQKLDDEYSDLLVNAFGTFKKPSTFPSHYNYHYNANEFVLNTVYNSSAIFINASLEEGFGLTGAESMACGCALITTDTLGSREYATTTNSIICPPNNAEKLYLSTKKLLDSNCERVRLAKQGFSDIQQFSYDKSVIVFKEIIESLFEV